jgi:uncharacterized protein YraI
MSSISNGAMTRRAFLRTIAGGSAALAALGLVAPLSHQAALASGNLRTTAALNLRSGADMTAGVILVLPYNAVVAATGAAQNGFTQVSYNGKTGWAKNEFLIAANDGGADTPPYRGTDKTTAAVNMREGAGTGYGVLRVIPAGASVKVYDEYANYFWLVSYQGQYGWVHRDYLAGDGSGNGQVYTGMGKTTAAVNFRSGAGTNFPVIQVLPSGTAIELYAGPAGAFQLVRYAGKFGYIHSDYVAGTN